MAKKPNKQVEAAVAGVLGTEATHVEVQTSTDAPAAVQVDSKPPRKQYILRVVEGAYFRPGTEEAPNARLEWYKRLCQYNGKTLEEFLASVQANPPSTPKKGKLTGQLEPPAGWLTFFKGQKKGAAKLLTLEEVQQ